MRYREIFESVFPEAAYDIISSYVTHGSLKSPNEFDNQFDKLMRLLPRPQREMLLYRVLRLSDRQIQQIQTGLTLEARRYSSWTKSQRSLDRLLYDRRHDQKLVVIKSQIPPQNIVIDVANFYKKHQLTTGDFEEYGRYVKPEQEVIIRDISLTITLEMVIEIIEPHPPNTKVPKIGTSFTATNGTREKIKFVDVESGNDGVFEITTIDSDRAFIRLNRKGKWIEVEK